MSGKTQAIVIGVLAVIIIAVLWWLPFGDRLVVLLGAFIKNAFWFGYQWVVFVLMVGLIVAGPGLFAYVVYALVCMWDRHEEAEESATLAFYWVVFVLTVIVGAFVCLAMAYYFPMPENTWLRWVYESLGWRGYWERLPWGWLILGLVSSAIGFAISTDHHSPDVRGW